MFTQNDQQNNIVMNRKMTSAPSIEACLQQLQRKEEQRAQDSRHQYLSNLKAQCLIRQNALTTAESLILAYQKENQTLKNENMFLRGELQVLGEKIAQSETQAQMIKTLEKSLLKHSMRINQLLEQNIVNEQKIHHLEKELAQAQRFSNKVKASRDKQEIKRERKEAQGQFKNYLRLPLNQDMPRSQPLRDNSDRRVLEWKLKQKDEQVVMLLKRLRDMEERVQASRKQRQPTYDSMDASTKQSKKMNVSQFQH